MSTSSNQISAISYVPQPFFYPPDGSSHPFEVSLDVASGYAAWESVTNAEGIFDPRLSNAAELVTSLNNQSPNVGLSTAFTVSFSHFKNGISNMRGTTTVALIGCSLLSYADDGLGNPDLTTEREEFITYSIETTGLVDGANDSGKGFAYNSNNKVTSFGAELQPSIISGGQCNLIVSGLDNPAAGASEAEVTVILHAARIGRRHLKFSVGHLFVGIDVLVNQNPDVFSWRIGVMNDRQPTRDYGHINSDGTLIRRASGEIVRVPYHMLNGSEIRNIHSDNLVETIYPDPNLLDMVKSNVSYPILFNPYPAGPYTGTLTKEQFTMMARQNFFAIYGYFEEDVDVQTDANKDGLNTNYRMRYRVAETR